MKSEIICIIDESGSMAVLKHDSIGGFNTFLKTQQAVPGEGKLTLVKFDHTYSLTYAGKDLAVAEPLNDTNYVPKGMTALLDAVGKTLNEQGKRIHDEGWAEKVIVCIMTDGEENSSTKYTRAQIQAMIDHAQKHGWSFIFLGANQDSFAEAGKLGIDTKLPSNMAANYAHTGAGVKASYSTVSASVTSTRGGGPTNIPVPNTGGKGAA